MEWRQKGEGETHQGRALGTRVCYRPFGHCEVDLLLQLRLAIIGGSEHRGAMTFLKVEQNQSACSVPWRGGGRSTRPSLEGRGGECLGLLR